MFALQHASCLNTPSCYSVISQSAIWANEAGSGGSGLKSGSISRLPVISPISCISPFVFLITPSSDHVQSLWKAPRGASNRRQPLSRCSVISLIPPPTVSCARHSHRLRKGIWAQAKRDFFFLPSAFRRRHFVPDTKPRWERKKLPASLRLQPTKGFSRDLSDYSPQLPFLLSYITLVFPFLSLI